MFHSLWQNLVDWKRQDKEYLKFLHKTKTKDVEDETAIFDCRPVDQW